MHVRALVWLAPLVLLLPASASAETYTDEDLGFSVLVPDGFRGIPIAGGEEYIVAKWQSEREYYDKESWSYRPEMKVVLFDPKGKKTAEVEKQGDVTKIQVKNPYKSYKDWIRSDATGGRYISKEEETSVHDIPTTLFEVAYEKLTTPRHGLAFVYHAPDIDYCLTTEVLEQHWQKLSPMLMKSMKSFKIFPRKGTVKREVTGEGNDVLLRGDLSKLSPEERFERRQARFEKQLRLATERLTDGWLVKRSKNYVALSHTDAKYTGEILDLAEAVRAWAEEKLAFYGTGIAGSEMIRICKDWDEEHAINDLSARSGGWSWEITISRNEGFWGFGNIASSIFDTWLDDKNPRLAYGNPPWIENGLREWIRTAYMKGGKLTFRPDADLYVALKLAAKNNTLISPREMLQMTYSDLSKRDDAAGGGNVSPRGFGLSASPWQQASGFLRYLLDGPGKTSPRTKDLLKRYVTELDLYLKEEDEKPGDGSTYVAPKTEEEEAERLKNRTTYWKDHQSAMLKGVFERVFKDWTDADWAALEKSYKAYAS